MEGKGREGVERAMLVSTKIVLMKSMFEYEDLCSIIECKCASSSRSDSTSDCNITYIPQMFNLSICILLSETHIPSPFPR